MPAFLSRPTHNIMSDAGDEPEVEAQEEEAQQEEEPAAEEEDAGGAELEDAGADEEVSGMLSSRGTGETRAMEAAIST